MKQIANEVQQKLKELIAERPESDKGKRLFDAMRYSSERGKRLRPYLLVKTAELFNVDKEKSLRAGCALEMIHCFSLIHDDLPAIDNDDLRRGFKTCHKQFDEPTAILAGDGLLASAFAVLSDPQTHPKAEIRIKLVDLYAKSAMGMIEGEFIDILADHGERFNLQEISHMQNLKTGCLISCAAIAGAILGNASEKETAALRNYSLDIGLAFQIADDILDVVGDEKKVGKALRKDAKAGKATFVSLLGLDGARKKEREIIDHAINELFIFGEKSDKLVELAKFIIERDK